MHGHQHCTYLALSLDMPNECIINYEWQDAVRRNNKPWLVVCMDDRIHTWKSERLLIDVHPCNYESAYGGGCTKSLNPSMPSTCIDQPCLKMHTLHASPYLPDTCISSGMIAGPVPVARLSFDTISTSSNNGTCGIPPTCAHLQHHMTNNVHEVQIMPLSCITVHYATLSHENHHELWCILWTESWQALGTRQRYIPTATLHLASQVKLPCA